MDMTLHKERVMVMDRLKTRWYDRAVGNPQISTHTLLKEMIKDCQELIESDF